ncbi:23529_t:CDS:2, partial [Racocetra persica]
GKTRYQINSEIRQKERAVESLSHEYSSHKLSSDDIKMCLYSIGDNNSYLRTNRDCCDRMLKHLIDHFHPREVRDGYSLAISSGRNGARLTHNHEMQYCYANQTLSLWSEIQNEMFMLWFLADRDMLLETNTYRLRDTGQGLNRVQDCPSVSKAMRTILHRAQQKAGYWVGSSVIHLGDKNVPNALMFIDKYNQVSRILNPILICLDNIRPLVEKNSGIRSYIKDSFGGVEELTKKILADFFRYAFDGSGADNFFDAGSCIDGRLTSAWNWCSLIEKKIYFPVFLLT